MRVLFHGWEFPPNGTGVGRYVEAMSRALMEIGHEVIVTTGTAPGYPAVEHGPHGAVYRLYRREQRYSRGVTREVLDLAASNRVDWIECADHLGEGARLMRVRVRPPIVLKVHNCNALRVVRHVEALHGWQHVTIALALARNWRQWAAERSSLLRADWVLAPSESLRRELESQYARLRNRVRVLPNPAIPADDAWREALAPVVLFAGRIAIGKGIQYLPAMMRALVARFPDVRLEIAGADSYARGLGSLREWLNRRMGPLVPHVEYLGKLGPSDMDAAYRRAWVVVVPSRWDSFSYVTLEAMGRARPVVVSPSGGMRELVEGTGAPVVAPEAPAFADAVTAFLQDRALRERVGKAERERFLQNYQPAAIAERYVDLVADMLGLS